MLALRRRAERPPALRAPSLPGSRRIVLEEHEEPGAEFGFGRLVLHTLRGLAINEPLGLALAAALEEDCGLPVRKMSRRRPHPPLRPEGRGLRSPWPLAAPSDPSRERGGSMPSSVARPGGSGIFGAQFRENAGRALLLPRGLPGKRRPLWMTRLRAKKLFEAVRGERTFPVIVETWRSCLGDLFDLDAARELAPASPMAASSCRPSRAARPRPSRARPCGRRWATTCTGATSSRAGPRPRYRTE
jgi:ATP-dependent Lhr-like helicase